MAREVMTPNDPRGQGWRIAGWGLAATLLLIPAVAMRFTDEVRWDGADFIFAGVMIGSVGLLLELAARASRSSAYRAGVALALLSAFLLVWINVAVGMIGSEGDPRNLMFLGVIAIGTIGAVVTRARPRGMMWAMTSAAIAQLAIALLAVVMGGPKLALLIAAFALIMLASAWLFSVAARQQ